MIRFLSHEPPKACTFSIPIICKTRSKLISSVEPISTSDLYTL